MLWSLFIFTIFTFLEQSPNIVFFPELFLNCTPHLFLWMMALKARPSRHDCVKSWTLTPGYFWVVFWAHRSSASFAVRSSCPIVISEILKKEKKPLSDKCVKYCNTGHKISFSENDPVKNCIFIEPA